MEYLRNSEEHGGANPRGHRDYLMSAEVDVPRMEDDVIVCIADALREELLGAVSCYIVHARVAFVRSNNHRLIKHADDDGDDDDDDDDEQIGHRSGSSSSSSSSTKINCLSMWLTVTDINAGFHLSAARFSRT